MAAICRGRTVFIIAHRLSTVRQCDRIIVLEKGRIVEQGNHEHLLKVNGYYARLHSYQNHTPVLRQVPNGRKTNPHQKVKSNITIKPKKDSRHGAVNGTTEIEKVDESWAIEMLEALEREERENENSPKQ
jgi:ABC-type multidrug transport system ATPase subunit